jgi:hypothetical protein
MSKCPQIEQIIWNLSYSNNLMKTVPSTGVA